MRIFGKEVSRGVLIAIALIIIFIILGVSSKTTKEQTNTPQKKQQNNINQDEIENKLLGRWKNTRNGELYYFHENNEVDISNAGTFEYKIKDNTIEIIENEELVEKFKFNIKGNNIVFSGNKLVRLDKNVLGVKINLPKFNSYGTVLVNKENNKEFYTIDENLQVDKIDLTKISKEYEIVNLDRFSKDGKAIIKIAEGKIDEDNQETLVGVVDKNGDWIIEPVYSEYESYIESSFPDGSFGIFIDTRPDEYGERTEKYKLINIDKGTEVETIDSDKLEEVKIFSDTVLYNGNLYCKNGQKKKIKEVTNLLDNFFYTENLNYEEQGNYIVYKDRDKEMVYSFDNKLNLIDKKPFDINSTYRLAKNGAIYSFKDDEIVEDKKVVINDKNYRSVFTYYPIEELMENIHGYKYFQAIKNDGDNGYFIIVDNNGKVVLDENNRIIEINEKLSGKNYYQSIFVRNLDEENNFIEDEEKILDLRNCEIIEFADFTNKILQQIGLSYDNIDDEVIEYNF